MAGAPLAASALFCGDGTLDFGEACDDSNVLPGDGCSAACTLEACGNNVLDPGEICDPATGIAVGCITGTELACDSALADALSCDVNCTAVLCGDGRWNLAVEACDPTATYAGYLGTPAGCDGPTGVGACTPSAWGDGTLNPANSEECDDGNVLTGDGCDIHLLTLCGNGYQTSTGGNVIPELCDDGDLVNGDGCDDNCKPTLCGNGRLTSTGGNVNPEACDDGNLTNGDGCDAGCQFETCQNGLLQAGEQCDDSNNVNGDGCDVNCKIESCGNGILQPVIGVSPFVEQCDDGGFVDGDGCDSNCRLEKCGNGFVQTGELCDPATGTTGNPLIAAANTAACDKDCTVPFCQDNVTNTFAGEQCDDGNGLCGDGCRANCLSETCGDGLVDCGEQCDPFPGNTVNGDGCDSNCDLETCSNGVVQPLLGETCDDGNLVDGDGCDSNCKLTACGNGVMAGLEACDDGNLISGDGCDSNCKVTACGNGVKTAGEECDPAPGNIVNGDGCDSLCRDEVCGNNVLGTGRSPVEVCDDGNSILTDGCVALQTPNPGFGCFPQIDGDATKAGPYLLNAYDIGNDGCEAMAWSTATPPNQKPSKPVLKITRYGTAGLQGITASGYFNPAQNKVCEDGLTTCTTSANCTAVPGADSCGIPRPNLQGVHFEVRNLLSPTTGAWLPIYKIDVPGELGAPGGEYQLQSATPVCGNRRDGWKVRTSGTRTTYSYVNSSGLIPLVGGIDGICTESAKGVKSLKLVYDASKNQWSYSVTIRNTTLSSLPVVSSGLIQGTIQTQLGLGVQNLAGLADDPGDIGNCADAQFRGAGSGGSGSAAGCKVVGTGISCK